MLMTCWCSWLVSGSVVNLVVWVLPAVAAAMFLNSLRKCDSGLQFLWWWLRTRLRVILCRLLGTCVSGRTWSGRMTVSARFVLMYLRKNIEPSIICVVGPSLKSMPDIFSAARMLGRWWCSLWTVLTALRLLWWALLRLALTGKAR